MRKLLIALSLGLALLGLVAVSTVTADTNLPDIPAHRHYIVQPDGTMTEVGPNVCDKPNLQNAFNQFHSNLHFAVPGSEGPEVSAPGLHNFRGAELTARGCSFDPTP